MEGYYSDGRIDAGVFRSFLVQQCPQCKDAPWIGLLEACPDCGGDLTLVRNPALEWQRQWRPETDLLTGMTLPVAERDWVIRTGNVRPNVEQRWVAVGVKLSGVDEGGD